MSRARDESRPPTPSYRQPRTPVSPAKENDMTESATERVKGPASYFPSIEQKYGKSIDEWKAIIRESGLTTWKELMPLMKNEHGMGHGHANALVLHTLNEIK